MSAAASLGGRGARGAVITMVGQVLRIAIQAAGVIVMARILVPADFGLIAMVTAIVGVGDILRDFGLANAAVQAEKLTTKQRSNLFWINTALGGATGILAFLASWPVADLYGDSRLVAITQIIALTYLFNGVASQYRASLQRSLAFGSMVSAEIMGLAVGVGVGIVGGILGLGYWALVAQFVINSFIVMIALALSARWVPRGIYRHQDTRQFMRFGFQMIGYQLLTYASKNVDSIVIGQRFGPTALGFYNRAFQLLTLPLSQIASPLLRVALPILAKVQNDITTFNRFLLRAQSALLVSMLFILSALCALAEPVVRIVLGEAWLPVVGIFRILAIAGIFQMASYPLLWAFIALGLTKANLVQAIVARPIAIGLVIAGGYLSVVGVAWGYALGSLIAWPIAMMYLRRESAVEVRRLFANALRILCANAFGGCGAFAALTFMQVANPVAALAVGIATMIITMAPLVVLVPVLREDYRYVMRVGFKAIRG